MEEELETWEEGEPGSMWIRQQDTVERKLPSERPDRKTCELSTVPVLEMKS